MKKALVLFSGGLDSSTCLAMALDAGHEVFPLTVDYGQRHDVEIEASKRLFEFYKARPEFADRLHEPFLFKLDLRQFGGSALTDEGVKLEDFQEGKEGIPASYVPARNTIFLSLALAYAETLGADHIYIGVNAVDYSGYPDCRPEYIEAYQELARLATKRGVEGQPPLIHTPLISLTKGEIIKKGLSLGLPYELSWSCYRGEPPACGTCDSCVLRLRGFREAGVDDPIDYRT